jgi:hypothetical protein
MFQAIGLVHFLLSMLPHPFNSNFQSSFVLVLFTELCEVLISLGAEIVLPFRGKGIVLLE